LPEPFDGKRRGSAIKARMREQRRAQLWMGRWGDVARGPDAGVEGCDGC
jgi:hypothetical protein